MVSGPVVMTPPGAVRVKVKVKVPEDGAVHLVETGAAVVVDGAV
jgi:hypothetical protein